MNITISKSDFSGKIPMASSKSHLHRALICASLGNKPTKLYYNGSSDDVIATINCLNVLGAKIDDKGEYFEIIPVKEAKGGIINCNESGSTLRFMLPLVCALGVECTIKGTKKLLSRPLDPLVNELVSHGAVIEKTEEYIKTSGRLSGGKYSIRGDVSSQFITGLLMALPLLKEESILEITGKIESRPYIEMTLDALKNFSCTAETEDERVYKIVPMGRYNNPESLRAEGDWSNGAFWCVLGALLENGIEIEGLETDSAQGDKAIIGISRLAGASVEICDSCIRIARNGLKSFSYNCGNTPDLVPVMSVLASVCEGQSRLYNVERLRMKESDRIETTMDMICSLGGEIEYKEDALIITGREKLEGGTVDSHNDHRIAMSAAVASAVCKNPVTITGANAVNKSYRSFWNVFESIGGNVNKWEE
ncbi:MAG: 3-phosphoshikimate 1-carboxyvinyltransferase [Clostridia bacterium]|nr:3-phosphoshikimate 1-carboxyvinyltransferase [Clostridia bacterium]